MGAIKEDEEDVALSAMEFWCVLVEEELILQEAIDDGEEDEGALLNIAAQASTFFVPVLLECLLKRHSHEDPDDRTVHASASWCLALFAECVKDPVVQLVKPFIVQNFNQESWVQQDAATQALGAILEGPSTQTLAPIVAESAPLLIERLKTPGFSVAVRDTTSWVLARVLEFSPDSIPPAALQSLLEAFLVSMKQEPRVAVHSCYAITQLVDYVESSMTEGTPATTPLSQFTEHLMQGLIEASNREDASETANGSELFTSAYSTLGDLIRVSGADVQPLMAQLMTTVLQKLAQTLQPDALQMQQDVVFLHNVQGQCCGVLSEICKKLSPEAVAGSTHDMLQGFLRVLNVESSEVHEEALMSISALVNCIGAHFLPFMDQVAPVLKAALAENTCRHVCAAGVGLVSDLSRELGKQFLPYCDDVMRRLLQLLMCEQTPVQSSQRFFPHSPTSLWR